MSYCVLHCVFRLIALFQAILTYRERIHYVFVVFRRKHNGEVRFPTTNDHFFDHSLVEDDFHLTEYFIP